MDQLAGFSLDDANRINRQVLRQERQQHNLHPPRGTNSAPRTARLEGFLLTDLAASSNGGKNPTSAQMQVYRGEGTAWEAAEVVTIVNRNDQWSAVATDYAEAFEINGELRAIPLAYGGFYQIGQIGCDPFDCVYPGTTTGQTNCAKSADSWAIHFGPVLSCYSSKLAGGLHVLDYVTGCTWTSATFSFDSTTAFWRLTINTAGTCTLQLIRTDNSAIVLYYGKPGAEWCATCDNLLTGCGYAGQLPTNCRYIPGQVCAKPEGGSSGIITSCCPDSRVPVNLTVAFNSPPHDEPCFGLPGSSYVLTYSGGVWFYSSLAGGITINITLQCQVIGGASTWVLSVQTLESGCTDITPACTLTSQTCSPFGLTFKVDYTGESCCYTVTPVIFTVTIS